AHACWGHMNLYNPASDFYPLVAGILAAVCCALLGNFLVLRRISLMGDAISHSVLPGLVIAIVIVSTRSPLAMFIGAAVAGVLTVVLIELVKRLGRVEPGAAMGVVFSVFFALGVLLIEQTDVASLDIDADCVLYGSLETLGLVRAPANLEQALRPELWLGYRVEPGAIDPISGRVIESGLIHRGMPRQVITLLAATLLATVFVVALFKELRIAAFDPALATAQGFSASRIHSMLMVFVAIATVASFEAVGSILVIAMLICPAATARLLTDRLLPQLVVSVIVAIASAVGGYFAAIAIPAAFDKEPVSAAGTMTVLSGVLLAVSIVFSPSHGVVRRVIRRARLAKRIAIDDLLAAIYRGSEAGLDSIDRGSIERVLVGQPAQTAMTTAVRTGLVEDRSGQLSLTDVGRERAAELVRRHRLWEHYLVDRAGIRPDHVHDPAEQLEHIATEPPPGPSTDPHGRDIPPATADDARNQT
ncbi:MAG: metal ABC transporter permease, partial [Planctomycetota bacterium]